MAPNGLVTREELRAHLAPIRADIWEVKGDVKTILRAVAKNEGALQSETARYSIGASRATIVMATASALSFLVTLCLALLSIKGAL